MDQIEHLLKQNDANSKIAGLVLAINYLKNESKDNVERDLETIYQSMGRKFLCKLLASPLFTNNSLQINPTSITCFQVAISITKAMISNPSINNQIIAGILPLFTNIMAQIANKDALNALNHSIIDCTFMILQCYHNYNKNNSQKLIPYYIVTKSNHFNQKNAEKANVYSMTMPFLKYLSNDNEERKDSETNVFDQHKKIVKIIEFLILNCCKANINDQTQNIFIKTLIKSYKECQTKLKLEFPKLILSVFYHLFGDERANNERLAEYLMEIKEICVGALVSMSRMSVQHRLDIFKLIQMSLLFEKHKWFVINIEINKLNSEKLFLLVLSSVCNEIQSALEIPLWAKNKAKHGHQYDILNTNLNIFDKLLSFVISENEQIDAFISTFSAKTMHSIQGNIHNVIRSLFYYLTELKFAVFEKNSDIAIGAQQTNINANKEESAESAVDQKLEAINNKFKALRLNDILNDECYVLLDRMLCSISLYVGNDFQTFTDEFCGILSFILRQFGDKYLCVLCNVLSKMLTNDISESTENDKKYKKMIIDELYFNDYLFDIAIKEKLNELALQLTGGHKQELSELFELENEFLSLALLINDVFVFGNNRFISKLLNEDNIKNCQFETLINMVCRLSVSRESQEIVLPLIFVILRTINKTADAKLDKFVRNGIKIHIPNLMKIANVCQQYEHAWLDDIAMDLMQLQQN